MTKQGTPGRIILAGLTAMVPLAATAVLAATIQPVEHAPIDFETSRTVSSQRTLACTGALTGVEETAVNSSDSAFQIAGPSTSVALRTTALEPETGLLFGQSEVAQTQLLENGEPKRPKLSIESDGHDPKPVDGTAGKGDFITYGTGNLTTDFTVVSSSHESLEPVMDSTVSSVTAQGDYRSMAFSRCIVPAVSSTFVGVSTMPGASSTLTLTNPSARAAHARITVYTPDGIAPSSAANEVTVQGGESTEVLIESLASGHDAVAVQVEVQGSALSMFMDSSERDGLTPHGAEFISSSGSDTSAVFPGVGRKSGSPVPDVIVANSNGNEAQVNVSAISTSGEKTELSAQSIPAGSVKRISMDDLPEGTYTVLVDSSMELHSTVRSYVSGADLPGDTVGTVQEFASHSPSKALTRASLLALPRRSVGASLTLYSQVETSVSVQGILADGTLTEAKSLELSSEHTATISGTDIAGSGKEEELVSVVVVPEDAGHIYGAWTQYLPSANTGELLSTLALVSANEATINVGVRVTP